MKHEKALKILPASLAMGSFLIGLGIPSPLAFPPVAQGSQSQNDFSELDELIRLTACSDNT